MSEKKWFSVRMVLECRFSDDTLPADALYEDRLIVLRANDEQEAKSKGEEIGKASKHEYKNQYGETVLWEFREVLEVLQLFDDSIKDGTEVFWDLIGGEEFKRLRKAYGLPE